MTSDLRRGSAARVILDTDFLYDVQLSLEVIDVMLFVCENLHAAHETVVAYLYRLRDPDSIVDGIQFRASDRSESAP